MDHRSKSSSRNPTSGLFNKPGISYPTPNLAEYIIVERKTIDSKAAPIAYGTAHPKFSEAKLIDQRFEGEEDNKKTYLQIYRRTGSNAQQETYNFSYQYANNSPDHPIIIRSYVVPRSTYAASTKLARGTPDPQFSTALLVQEDTQDIEGDNWNVRVIRIYETLPGPAIITYDYDPELAALVQTTRQTIISGTTPPIDPLQLTLQESPEDKYRTIRISSKLLELPPSKTEYKVGKFPFPALLFDIDLFVAQLTTDPDRSEVLWYPNRRPAPQVPAFYRITTTFHSSGPPTETIYTIPTRDVIYRGISFQLSIPDVLCDAISVTASFFADKKYGNLTENFSISATSLSATNYQSDIGQWKITGADIERWRGQIWVKQKTEVLLV